VAAHPSGRQPDLTYDRGVLLSWSPWEGGDLAVSVVNGSGLTAAAENRHYDRDNNKPVAVRYSQELGPVRVGGFAYRGRERSGGVTDRITIWGSDATLSLGLLEIDAQYLHRDDTNPLFVPGNAGTTVHSGFAEVLYGPFGPDSRWTVAGLYNWIDADAAIVSLRLGDDTETGGFRERYQSAAAGVHYLLRRNLRLMGEGAYDIERERTRFTAGVVMAF
jgi:hypothetical protein